MKRTITIALVLTLAGCAGGSLRWPGADPEPVAPDPVLVNPAPEPPPVIRRQSRAAPPPPVARVNPAEQKLACRSDTCKRECVPENPQQPKWCVYYDVPSR